MSDVASRAASRKKEGGSKSKKKQQQRKGQLIWYRDLNGFVQDSSIAHFIPSQDEPLTEQLNAIMRFAIYFTVFMLVIKKDPNVLFIAIIVGATTYVVHESSAREEDRKHGTMEKLKLKKANSGKVCVRPTKDNPFMNVSFNDVKEFPNRPPACNPTHADVREKVEDKFDHDLYRDVDDIYGRKTSSRQFYTAPVTTIPNDQTAFAEWCYKMPPTCKEGNGLQCSRNLDSLIP